MIRIIRVNKMMDKEEVFITKSFEETQRLGKEFVKRILYVQGVSLSKNSACMIALYGDLGSGKTTFVQGLAKGLGIKRRIISPTFVIVRRYVLKSKNSKVKSQKYNSKFKSLELRYFYHIDLYRIQNEKSIEGLGLEEIISDPQSIVAIEWAEKMGNLLPKLRWDIRFEYADGDRRRITIASVI